jgi:hypothetical protein
MRVPVRRKLSGNGSPRWHSFIATREQSAAHATTRKYNYITTRSQVEKLRVGVLSKYQPYRSVGSGYIGPDRSLLRVVAITSMQIGQETREQMERYALSMMSKQTFTKTDLLKEIGSLGRLS